MYIHIIISTPGNQPQPDIKVSSFRIQIEFGGLAGGLGVPSAEPCQGVQIPKLRQLEQRILESINFTGNFQNRRILLALMPGGPPFPSIIIRTGIGYLAGRTGALLKQIFKGAGSSQQRIFKIGLLLAQTVFDSYPFC